MYFKFYNLLKKLIELISVLLFLPFLLYMGSGV